jgi:hypothetical protein
MSSGFAVWRSSCIIKQTNPFSAVLFPILGKHTHGFIVCMMHVSLFLCNLCICVVKLTQA